MVNTRRSESHSARLKAHQTRGSTKLEEEEEEEEEEDLSSSPKEEESDLGATDEETSSNSPLIKTQEQIKKKARESEVVTIERDFQRKFPSNETSHKTISVERRRLIYSRKMEEQLLQNSNFSEEEYYPNSTHRQRNLVRKNRMLRRTALSLRPIRQKSYADHSPLHFDTDSDGVLKRTTRRSRNVESRSWLADSQMHKVGYPNLNAGYSEEDSRDAVEHENVEIAQPVTRHSRRRVKPTYYFDEYEEVPTIRRTRRAVQTVVREVRIPHSRTRKSDSNEKDSKEDLNRSTRTRSAKVIEERITEEDDDSKSSNENAVEDNQVKEKTEEVIPNGPQIKEDQVSTSEGEETDVERPVASRTLRSRRGREMLRGNRKKILESDSSESEEDGGRKYSLRDRVPKAAPKAMQTSVLRRDHERRGQRRFTRRRRKSSSSSTSSSRSSDRCRKAPKSPHSKKEMMKSGAGGSNNIVPIKPETLDQSVRFNSIGGLESHIQCLKEMILLPMMYPEVFRQFQVQPPRGVLFHGPPGTGKTLIARALANECSFGTKKVAFFMRKGADLLSKWIGESEKQLRLLFEQANEMKPSIIFFDELDGLAPVRSSRQDQVHASIVSTLLALMDGLTDRGDVIVIGATNRIDAIDPALRRPGRFDRELFFPLPSKSEREEILKVHVTLWNQPPSTDLLGYLAENTVGYCGSDLRALCSEAVIQSFRRTYPQVYESEHRLLLNPENVKVEKIDFLRAKSMLVPSSHRIVSGLGKKLLPILEPLLASCINNALGTLEQIFPHGLNAALAKVKLSTNIRPAQFLLTGNGPEHGQTNYVAPALLFKMEHIHSYLLDLASLYKEPGRSPEEACIQVFTEAKRNIPSIIYIPSIDEWWELASETLRAIFLSQLKAVDANIPILFLATANVVFDELPEPLLEVFSSYRKEIQEMVVPPVEARRQFFKTLLETCLKPIRQARDRPNTPPLLPRAPTPPPAPITEEQAQKLYDSEEHTLRELRIFLRDMCKKLANNKLFFMFTKPVDTEEVPDYTEIIKQPMDLETMMMKVDFHRYECAKDFLSDIELICQNALEYNPARSSADKQIRHRACSLRDYAYTLIKTEMDSDFEDKCQGIKHARKKRKACTSKYLPAYIKTPERLKNPNGTKFGNSDLFSDVNGHNIDIEEPREEAFEEESNCTPLKNRISPIRKRKVNSWQHGILKKRKKSTIIKKEKNSSDESKENDPDSSTMEIPQMPEDSVAASTADISTALTINCDSQKYVSSSISERSSQKIVSDLLSPSELLDSQMYFDEVDQALNENTTVMTKSIECSESELDKILDQTVKYTEDYPLNLLLDLYNQYNAIIKKFSKTYLRQTLPKELSKELQRFKKFRSQDNNLSNSTPPKIP